MKKPYRPWLGRVDWYIIRTFISTFLFSIGLILAVAVVFDVNDKITDFLKPEVPLSGILFRYYLNFIPYYANLFSPLFVFISVIFFTSKLAANSEIIAMLAEWDELPPLAPPRTWSLRRSSHSRPTCSTASSSLRATVYVLTSSRPTSSRAARSTRTISRSPLPKDTYLYIRDYESLSKRATSLAVDQFKGQNLISRLTADEAYYDTLDHWKLTDFHIRRFKGLEATDTIGYGLDTNLRISPADFLAMRRTL